MRLVFDPSALEDLRFWTQTNQRKSLKILDLIESVQRTPFEGIGKPEPLKFELTGAWSRRIDQEHRLVYGVDKDEIRIMNCRLHY